LIMGDKPKTVRHLGSRWETPENASDDNSILRSLHRCGTIYEGQLANRHPRNFKGHDCPRFQAALDRLVRYGYAERLMGMQGNSVRVRLTPAGQPFAMDLVCREQTIQPHHIPGSQADIDSKRIRKEEGFDE
jgi:hypothetical protein